MNPEPLAFPHFSSPTQEATLELMINLVFRKGMLRNKGSGLSQDLLSSVGTTTSIGFRVRKTRVGRCITLDNKLLNLSEPQSLHL